MITLVGSGNVATWIATRLRKSQDFPVSQVYSRSMENAKAVADICGAAPVTDLQKLSRDSEVYLFSLKDDAYPEVLAQIPFRMPVALHTAGSVSQHIFKDFADEYGVVYPLQTFTKGMDFDHLKVPICLETNHLSSKAALVRKLAECLSPEVNEVDEQQRGFIHLAAVFACNFSNAMYQISDEILKNHNLDFEILKPLIQTNLNKLDTMSPAQAQTGPAKRGDVSVMNKHLDMLTTDEQKEIYKLISNFIVNK